MEDNKRKNRYMKDGKIRFHSYESLEYEMSMRVAGHNPVYYRKLLARVYDYIFNCDSRNTGVSLLEVSENAKVGLELTVLVVRILEKTKFVQFVDEHTVISVARKNENNQ